MFTGIIQGIGKVVKLHGNTVWIALPFKRLQKGESISIEGACLTVAKQSRGCAAFDIGPETSRVTTLGALTRGARVNLERALRYGDRLGGHWVSGHVEGVGRISRIERAGGSRWVFITVPAALRRFMIPKGSVAIDGVSLTIAAKGPGTIKIMIIPHTLAYTTFGRKNPGARVNIEPDLLAKYAQAAPRRGRRSKRFVPR